MSIYSGFPTRRDEQKYNSLLSKLLSLLQEHLLSLLGPTPELPPKFSRNYTRILSRMRDYEEHKYLPPKFTAIMHPLCKAVGLPQAVELRPVKERVQTESEVQNRKASSRSLHKARFNSGIHEQLTAPPKKFLPPKDQNKGDISFDQKPPSSSPSGLHPARALFQSCSSKLSRPKTLKGIFPANHRVELTQQYDQGVGIGEWEAGRPRVGSQGGRVRYRAFQALQEAQEQIKIKSRQVPLREEMRRKLKTEGEGEGLQRDGEL